MRLSAVQFGPDMRYRQQIGEFDGDKKRTLLVSTKNAAGNPFTQPSIKRQRAAGIRQVRTQQGDAAGGSLRNDLVRASSAPRYSLMLTLMQLGAALRGAQGAAARTGSGNSGQTKADDPAGVEPALARVGPGPDRLETFSPQSTFARPLASVAPAIRGAAPRREAQLKGRPALTGMPKTQTYAQAAAQCLPQVATARHRRAASLAAQSAASTVPPDTDANSDAAHVAKLGQVLSDWVDYDKARAHAGDAYELLRAVLDHYGEPLPEIFKTTLDLSLIEDEERVEEAALLYHQLQSGGDGASNSSAVTLSSAQLRSLFMDALRSAAARHNALDQLFTLPPLNASTTTPFFDGFAMRHALGKSFEDLLAAPGISADPAFATASVQQKREWLSAKFAQMGESVQYRIGTPQHSLASVLLRVGKYRGQPVTGPFQDEEALLNAFRQLENAWSENRSTFPLNPRVLFAMHLAQSSGVELLSTEDLLDRYERIMQRAIQLSDQGDWDVRLWLQSIPAQWNADGNQWTNRGASVKREALLSVFDTLRRMSLRSETPAAAPAQKVWDFAQQLKQDGLIGEALAGDGWAEKTAALVSYASERLFAVYGSPPRFSRAEAARQILEQYGMGEAEMEQRRPYTLAGDNPNLSESKFGDRVDEFLARADWTGILERSMRVRGRIFYPRQELQKAEEAFNSKLPFDKWVQARAKEALRMGSSVITNATLEAKKSQIAANLAAETENHRAWMRGFKTWISTMPVLGPIDTIKEGIRGKNPGMVLLGVVFLLLDTLDLASGGKRAEGAEVHMKSMPAHRRPAMADFHHVTTKLGVDTVEVIGHAEDLAAPPQLRQQDGNVPPPYRSLATRIRNGESGVKWRGYEVVLIANENRIVPVKHAGGSYHEIDWHTGHRVRHARLVRRDAGTNTFRTNGGLRAGMPANRLTDSAGHLVKERITPIEVERFLASLTDGPAPPFDRLFHDCFAVLETRANALDDWNVQAFFARLYQSSHTFRRMLNHYYAKSPVGQRLWKLHFGGMPHHILGSMQTTVIQPRTLPSRNIEFPIKRDLANGEFMSASGKSPYNKEHVVLHEVIHALTDLKDLPIRRSSVNARLRMQLDRGPVVYLTDKILSEAGFSVEERVSYLDLAEGANDPRLQVAIHDTHMENLYLDPIVDRQRPPVTADTLVEEAPVKDRITVKQWQQMQRRLAAATGNKAIALLRQKFAERFKLLSSAGEGSSLDGAPLRRVTQVCDRFIRKSPTFRALVETMPEELGEGARPWDFVFDASAAPKNLATGNPLSGVDDFRKQIYLFDDHTSYLSERGLHHVEFERKIANAVIHAMTDLNVPKADLYKNRGAVVRLVDQVLAESGYYYPKQIVAALAAPSDSSRNMLRSQLTSARRSMAIEDAYIA